MLVRYDDDVTPSDIGYRQCPPHRNQNVESQLPGGRTSKRQALTKPDDGGMRLTTPESAVRPCQKVLAEKEMNVFLMKHVN